MADFVEMRRAVTHALHDNDCSCALQRRIEKHRANMNVEDWTPIMVDLFERIEQLESALDEVGNALVSIVGDNSNDWDLKHRVEGTDVLLDLASETFERYRCISDD
jgi:hypothetical protein